MHIAAADLNSIAYVRDVLRQQASLPLAPAVSSLWDDWSAELARLEIRLQQRGAQPASRGGE